MADKPLKSIQALNPATNADVTMEVIFGSKDLSGTSTYKSLLDQVGLTPYIKDAPTAYHLAKYMENEAHKQNISATNYARTVSASPSLKEVALRPTPTGGMRVSARGTPSLLEPIPGMGHLRNQVQIAPSVSDSSPSLHSLGGGSNGPSVQGGGPFPPPNPAANVESKSSLIKDASRVNRGKVVDKGKTFGAERVLPINYRESGAYARSDLSTSFFADRAQSHIRQAAINRSFRSEGVGGWSPQISPTPPYGGRGSRSGFIPHPQDSQIMEWGYYNGKLGKRHILQTGWDQNPDILEGSQTSRRYKQFEQYNRISDYSKGVGWLRETPVGRMGSSISSSASSLLERAKNSSMLYGGSDPNFTMSKLMGGMIGQIRELGTKKAVTGSPIQIVDALNRTSGVGGMLGAGGGSGGRGGFLGQIGQQFRHAAIWQAYTPLLAGASAVIGGYLGVTDYSDAAAQDLMGVNYNRQQRLDMKQKAMHAETVIPHLKSQEHLKTVKAVISSQNYGTSPQDLDDLNYKAHEVEMFASQGDMDPKQAARWSSRVANMIMTKSKHVKGMGFNEIHTRAMGSAGATQAAAVITGPEGQQYFNQAGAVMLNAGWAFPDIMARVATAHGVGVPASKVGIFDRNVLGGQENKHMAAAELINDQINANYDKTGKLELNTLPEPEAMKKYLSSKEGQNAIQLRAIQTGKILSSGDPVQINAYLNRMGKIIHYLNRHGYEANMYTGKGMLPVWEEYAGYSNEFVEKLRENTEAAQKGWADPGYHEKIQDVKQAGTPGAQLSTLWGSIVNFSVGAGQRGINDAKRGNRNNAVSWLTKGVNSFDFMGQIGEAYRIEDPRKRAAEMDRIKADNYDAYKAGSADLLTSKDFEAASSSAKIMSNVVPDVVRSWIPGSSVIADVAESLWGKILAETVNTRFSDWGRRKGVELQRSRGREFRGIAEHNSRVQDNLSDGFFDMLGVGSKTLPYSRVAPLDEKSTSSEIEARSLWEYKYGDRAAGANYYNARQKQNTLEVESIDIPGVGDAPNKTGVQDMSAFATALGGILAGAISAGFQGVTFAPVIYVNGVNAAMKEQNQEPPTALPFTPKQ